MDLKLDGIEDVVSADAIENGVWLHLRSPIVPPGEDEGPLLYLPGGLPSRARVRSVHSKYFRNKDLNIQTLAQSKAQRAKVSERDQVIADAVASERPRRFSYLVTALENVSKASPGIQIPSEADLYALASMKADVPGNYGWLVDQCMECAFDDNRYGGEAALGNEPAPKAAKASKA